MKTYNKPTPMNQRKPESSAYYGNVKWFCGEHKEYKNALNKIENAEQTEILGMAIEDASLGFERGEAEGYDNELEYCAAYFENAWSVAFGEWYS